MPTKVLMPQMGEAVVEATITKWLKQEGDTVDEFEPLVEVNTDKVDSEVPSPVSGILLKTLYQEGEVVAVDTVLAWIGQPGDAIPEDDGAPAKVADPPLAEPVTAPSSSPPAAPRPASSGGSTSFISPLVARIAAEHNVDLAQVTGSGPGGRITKKDILAHVGHPTVAPLPTVPTVSPDQQDRATFFSPVVARLAAEHGVDLTKVAGTGKGGRVTKKDILAYVEGRGESPAAPATVSGPLPGTTIKLSPVRRSIAEHMVHSKHTSPHVTTIMEADMSKVFEHRAAHKVEFAHQGVNLTFTAYFVVAAAAALKAYPLVNSSWTDDGIVVHQEINIGMATALGEEGLIVPVIKGADNLSLLGVAKAVNDLALRARNKKLKPDEVHGGTFTITNHGTSGSLFATPIINQPQCAILGTGAIQKRPVVIDDAIAIRPMVYLGLTFDHRILDGLAGDNFLMHIVSTLQTWS